MGEACCRGVRASEPSAPRHGDCRHGRATGECSARCCIRGSSANCLSVAGGDSTLGGSDALSVDPAEPGLGDLQPASPVAPGWEARRLEHAAQRPGKAICKAGAVWLPGFARDHLSSADAWRIVGDRLKRFRWLVAISLAWLMPIFRTIAGASS